MPDGVKMGCVNLSSIAFEIRLWVDKSDAHQLTLVLVRAITIIASSWAWHFPVHPHFK
jgi:hypothetical protein